MRVPLRFLSFFRSQAFPTGSSGHGGCTRRAWRTQGVRESGRDMPYAQQKKEAEGALEPFNLLPPPPSDQLFTACAKQGSRKHARRSPK